MAASSCAAFSHAICAGSTSASAATIAASALSRAAVRIRSFESSCTCTSACRRARTSTRALASASRQRTRLRASSGGSRGASSRRMPETTASALESRSACWLSRDSAAMSRSHDAARRCFSASPTESWARPRSNAARTSAGPWLRPAARTSACFSRAGTSAPGSRATGTCSGSGSGSGSTASAPAPTPRDLKLPRTGGGIIGAATAAAIPVRHPLDATAERALERHTGRARSAADAKGERLHKICLPAAATAAPPPAPPPRWPSPLCTRRSCRSPGSAPRAQRASRGCRPGPRAWGSGTSTAARA